MDELDKLNQPAGEAAPNPDSAASEPEQARETVEAAETASLTQPEQEGVPSTEAEAAAAAEAAGAELPGDDPVAEEEAGAESLLEEEEPGNDLTLSGRPVGTPYGRPFQSLLVQVFKIRKGTPREEVGLYRVKPTLISGFSIGMLKFMTLEFETVLLCKLLHFRDDDCVFAYTS